MRVYALTACHAHCVGDVLLVVESDKADMDVETFEDGFIARIITPEGGSASVGSVVAQLVDSKEEMSAVDSAAPAPTSAAPPTSSAPPAAPASTVKFESILMPALSSTMKEGKIVAWSKKVGDKVSSGAPLPLPPSLPSPRNNSPHASQETWCWWWRATRRTWTWSPSRTAT